MLMETRGSRRTLVLLPLLRRADPHEPAIGVAPHRMGLRFAIRTQGRDMRVSPALQQITMALRHDFDPCGCHDTSRRVTTASPRDRVPTTLGRECQTRDES